MKTKALLPLLLILSVPLCHLACKKAPPPPEYIEVNGVQVHLPKLEDVFANANDQQRALVGDIASNIRYSKYFEAMTSLDKLAADPANTEPQKKAANQVIEELKQALNKAPGK